MSQPFIGEIKMFGFNFAPRYYAFANGQLLPIAQNMALFSLLGTTYGGNGVNTFALPDLQGKTPMHMGNSAFGNYTQGSVGGAATHTLNLSEMPAHTHGVAATSAAAPATAVGPGNALPATANQQPYRSSPMQTVPMANGAVEFSGSSQSHENMQPYLVLNFCIALQGIFPSRN